MKSFGFQLNPKLIDYTSAIRNKGDIIGLLINILRFININKPTLSPLIIEDDQSEILLIIHIDKMSRIFVVEKNKIHTFQFPFKLFAFEDNLIIKYNDTVIDSGIISLLSTVFIDFDENKPLEEMLDKYWNAISDFEVEEKEAELVETLITFVLTFETGYLRFDNDEIRCNEMHPINHLDFYYSSNNTFKMGLSKRLEHGKMIDILDITKKCINIHV